LRSLYAELIQAIQLEIDSSDLKNQFLLNQSALRFRPLRKIAYQHVVLLEQQGDHLGAIKLLKRTQIIYPYKTKYLEAYIPAQYRQTFLTMLSEATPEFKPLR
jgi:hypothetical protein